MAEVQSERPRRARTDRADRPRHAHAPAFATVRWFTAAGGAEMSHFAPAGADEAPLDAARFAKRYGDVGLFDTRYVSARALEAIAFSL